MEYKLAQGNGGHIDIRAGRDVVTQDKLTFSLGNTDKKVRNVSIAAQGGNVELRRATYYHYDSDSTILISAVNVEDAKRAVAIIEDLVRDVEVGAVYKGKVTRIMAFGAFVEVLPGKEGLCHISQLAKRRVEKVEDVVHIGDMLDVKVTEIDRQGRVNLSHKVLL